MYIIYDIILILLALLYIPFYILRGKFHKGLFMRLGFIRRDIISAMRGRDAIWLHAVSVGEIAASKTLLEALKGRYPDYRFIVSTVTKSGNDLAKKTIGDKAYVIYLPFDIGFIARRVIKALKPRVFILIESELWPNLINAVSGAGGRLVVANGRISAPSFSGYRKIRFFLSGALKRIAAFSMQTEVDRARCIGLGVEPERVYVTGNIKYDITRPSDINGDYVRTHRDLLGLGPGEKLLIAGSTHTEEEEIILDAFRSIKAGCKNLRLLIAPRHIERVDRIARLIEEFGFFPMRFSCLKRGGVNPDTVFLLDSIGKLSKLYSIADLVFIGGSLVKKGGHNPIEPALYSKPIIFGNCMDNFREMSEQFLENGAAISASGRDGLISALYGLISDNEKALELGRNAKRLVELSRGATEKNLDIISGLLDRE